MIDRAFGKTMWKDAVRLDNAKNHSLEDRKLVLKAKEALRKMGRRDFFKENK